MSRPNASGQGGGASAEPTGLSQVEPQEGLAPSGFDPSRELDASYRDAVALADIVWRRYYRERAPNWKPLPDLRGVISQIDNMIAGLGSRLDDARWRFAQIAQMHSVDHGDIAERCMELARKGYAMTRRDSDGSPEGGDACGSVHDSAAPSGDRP